ncbi:MAG: superoxide dismutase [Spirochaetota bacterium]
MKRYTLPPLPYEYNALEPYIDAKTMEIHHTKHHAAYIEKLNGALDKYTHLYELPLEHLLANLPTLPEDIRTVVRNNGGGHYNHSLFWKILGGRGHLPQGKVLEAIKKTFGAVDNFVEEFSTAALNRFGSGWAWLSVNAIGELVVHSTPNQDSPIMEGLLPVLGLDVWEHAYYLTYQNRRGDYIKAFFNIINWNQVEENYNKALEAVAHCTSHPACRDVA